MSRSLLQRRTARDPSVAKLPRARELNLSHEMVTLARIVTLGTAYLFFPTIAFTYGMYLCTEGRFLDSFLVIFMGLLYVGALFIVGRARALLGDFPHILHSEAARFVLPVVPVVIALVTTAGLILLGEATHGSAFEFITDKARGLSTARLARYYLTSSLIGFGIAVWLTRAVRNPGGDGAFPQRMLSKRRLLLAVTLVTLTSFLDAIVRFPILSFPVFFLILIGTYVAKCPSERRGARANLTYLGALIYVNNRDCAKGISDKRRRLCEKLIADLKRGHIYVAYLRLLASRRAITRRSEEQQPHRGLAKVTGMLYYRLDRFDKVITQAALDNDELEKFEGRPSQTLISLDALARCHIGDSRNAREILAAGIERWPTNQYFRFHMAYVAWQEGDIGGALEALEGAVGLAQDDYDGIAIETLKARLLCEMALERYEPPRRRVFPGVREAVKLVERAMVRTKQFEERSGIRVGDEVKHACGYVYMLSGRYGAALDILRECVAASSHAGARLRLGVLEMVGTTDYSAASNQFQWLLNSLEIKERILRRNMPGVQVSFRKRFRRLVEHNLRRAQEASKRGVVFGDEIIFYHLQATPSIPAGALYDKNKLRERVKKGTLAERLELFEKDARDCWIDSDR